MDLTLFSKLSTENS